MSVLQKLTEGIVERSLQKEGAALLEKWEATGLLEGLEGDQSRAGMARLLENQAAQLLKEASSMGAGDVEGFASVAFPIVRRVFAGLLANDLVSVQPMSLPSGLIFFLDFQYSDATSSRNGVDQLDSVYGGGRVASEITGGVDDLTEGGGGFYNLANHYSHATASTAGLAAGTSEPAAGHAVLSAVSALGNTQVSALSEAQRKLIRFDPDLLADTSAFVMQKTMNVPSNMNRDALGSLQGTLADGTTARSGVSVVRRLTSISGSTLTLTLRSASTINSINALSGTYAMADEFEGAGALGSVRGANFPLEGAGDSGTTSLTANTDEIPEIDIKVDSIAVTAQTKKLKAKWTPELGQDLNAYHNLDAEVELTQILSEQIALEIDREIVNDLIKGATAGTYYWSRSPGLFVDRVTGLELGATAAAPDFTGTVSEWYETLVETINDVSAQIHRKTLRGGANFLVTSPEVANILEFTAGFRANVTHDSDRGTVGAVNVGSLSRKFDVHVDPYFPRNLVLVGRKGGSFLESGFVYAPYVPLQVTPTIFGVEDFVPRKGVMTRYAKKMVRPDMYGLVVCRGLLGESGS